VIREGVLGGGKVWGRGRAHSLTRKKEKKRGRWQTLAPGKGEKGKAGNKGQPKILRGKRMVCQGKERGKSKDGGGPFLTKGSSKLSIKEKKERTEGAVDRIHFST